MNPIEKKDLISVIIPVYNAKNSLDKCIYSIVEQSETNYEIILINDGSTDGSWELCKKWEKQSPRIHAYTQHNAGVSVARNFGLDKAHGKYILFVDADDELSLNALEKYKNYNLDQYDLIIGSYCKIGRLTKKKLVRKDEEYNTDRILEQIKEFDKLLSTPWGKLYKKEIITKYNLRFEEGRPFGEDHIFNLRYCQHIKKCRVISDITYNYTLGGMASSIKYYPYINQLNYRLLYEYLKYYCYATDNFFKMKICHQLEASILHYVSNCDDAEAVRKVNQTLDVFSDYLSDEYLGNEYYSEDLIDSIKSHDARHIISVVKKDNWKRLCLKKVKRLLIKANKYIKG